MGNEQPPLFLFLNLKTACYCIGNEHIIREQIFEHDHCR